MKTKEKKVHSQAGQDGIIEHIFNVIGTTNQWFVDIGAGDGLHLSNTANLSLAQWQGVRMDTEPQPNNHCIVRQEHVTRENVNNLLLKYKVPSVFDYLSIDIDGNDFWVWKGITKWFPRVVSIEFNSNHPWYAAVTIPYHPERKWDGTWFFGASLAALYKLGSRKGYRLVHIVDNLDAFFVRADCMGKLVSKTPEELLPEPIPCFTKDNRHWQPIAW